MTLQWRQWTVGLRKPFITKRGWGGEHGRTTQMCVCWSTPLEDGSERIEILCKGQNDDGWRGGESYIHRDARVSTASLTACFVLMSNKDTFSFSTGRDAWISDTLAGGQCFLSDWLFPAFTLPLSYRRRFCTSSPREKKPRATILPLHNCSPHPSARNGSPWITQHGL